MIWIGRCAGDSRCRVSGIFPPATDGMLGEAEQLLHAQRNRRAALGLVVDRRGGAGRRLEVGRRLVVEPAREVPGQERVERVRRDRRRRSRRGGSCRRGTARATPGSSARRASERSGQASPSARRRNSTRSRHCFSALRPRQPADPQRQNAARQRRGARLVGRNRQRLLGERQRAELAGGGGRAATPRRGRRRARRPSRSRVPRPPRCRQGSGARRAGCAPRPRGRRPRRSRETARPRAGRAPRAPPPARSPSGTRRACPARSRCGPDRPRRAGRRRSPLPLRERDWG